MTKYLSEGVRDPETYSFIEPPAVECSCCGARVDLYDNDNQCKCGSIFNGFGQMLAPREQWGEETGESVFEIYNGRAGEDY